MYKEPKTFKGFEVWFHGLMMSLKMHTYIIVTIFIMQLLIVFLYWLFFQFEVFILAVKTFFSFDPHYMLKSFMFLFKKSFLVFIFSFPLWLLYPVFLYRFKKKSVEIMKDSHIRGSSLESEKVVREMLIKRIQEEYKKRVENREQ